MADCLRITKGVDAIIHLGGDSVEGPWEGILQANIIGCYNMFEAARRNKVKRIVFPTSNHGHPESHRADDARRHHRNPIICHVGSVKCHGVWRFQLRDSYCFLNRSTLLIPPKPKPKTKAWKLEDCQLSLFSGDSIRKSEQ